MSSHFLGWQPPLCHKPNVLWQNKHESQAISFELCQNFYFSARACSSREIRWLLWRWREWLCQLQWDSIPSPPFVQAKWNAGIRQSKVLKCAALPPKQDCNDCSAIQEAPNTFLSSLLKEKKIYHLVLWIVVFSASDKQFSHHYDQGKN